MTGTEQQKPKTNWLATIAYVIPYLCVIGYLKWQYQVRLDMFIFGAGTWGIGCIAKMAVYHLWIGKMSHDDEHIWWTSALNGLASGITELGVALVFFAFMGIMNLAEVLAFGIGIGTIEVFVVATPGNPLKGTKLEKISEEMDAAVQRLDRGRFYYDYILPYVERALATAIHIGTRGLIYIAFHTMNPIPALIALSSFVLADGIGGYRLLYQGKLADFRRLHKFYFFLSAVAFVMVGAFIFYWWYAAPAPAP